jgi:hypothetical protein
MNSRPVKRIEDVIMLRTSQFSEDAGPMAHPVRPDSYMKMENFYTGLALCCLLLGDEFFLLLASLLACCSADGRGWFLTHIGGGCSVAFVLPQ